jgi:hypothetical protein
MQANTVNRRVKPTLETPFHIDYSWWERDLDGLRAYLVSHLPTEKQAHFQNGNSDQADSEIDWIDPDTAEVQRVDALQMALQEAAITDDFISANTSLVDAVFRVFLANHNTPQSPNELGETIGKRPEMILRTLAGPQVYKGIRPVAE